MINLPRLLRLMPVSERTFNTALGLSVVSWGVLGLTATGDEAWRSPVRWAIAGLNVLVGLLLIARQPVRTHGSLRQCALALPGLMIAGIAFRSATTPINWPAYAQAVFFAGCLLTSISLLWLGRCFALLPARRGLVTSGPYSVVRHPVYTGELIMIAACALASQTLWPWAVTAAAVLLVYLRVHAEEQLLTGDPAYRVYRHRVRGRLLPRPRSSRPSQDEAARR